MMKLSQDLQVVHDRIEVVHVGGDLGQRARDANDVTLERAAIYRLKV